MNLNISYNWLKEYLDTRETARDFAKRISLSGPSVDHITEKKPNFSKVVVGEIVSLEKHPNADKLRFCQVDIGSEVLNIVCGAPNIAVGQKVPVALVGGQVGEMKIEKATIRGVESFGMLCSQVELGIGDDHSGIYILPGYAQLGLPLEKLMPIEDTILDMEVTSNRPDAMSIIGLAREAGAILGEKFKYKMPKPNLKITGEEIKLKVSVKKSKLCPRYQAAVMTNVKVEPSPLWMQARLLSAGLRPINNLVDITNYILLEFGQPMHVFDYEKLQDAEINVRLAKRGEKIQALDGRMYELSDDDLVIADGKDPVAVAGIMGGELSAASASTKTIVLESANFSPMAIRKTARTLNLHSDSSNLFEKNLSPEGTEPALMRAVELVIELACGQVASKIFDEADYNQKEEKVKLKFDNVNKVLGVEIEEKKIKNILEDLGFEIGEATKNGLTVKTPWWRKNDVEGEHDLIEEIARVYGYQNLPTELPAGAIPAHAASGEFKIEDKTKDILAGFGLTEIYAYSFISEKLIKNSLLKVDNHLQVSNPLSADFEYMRTSLLPGLIEALAENEAESEAQIFELSKVFLSKENDLPSEPRRLGIGMMASKKEKVFADLKGAMEALMIKLNINHYKFTPVEDNFLENGQALGIEVDGKIIGRFGSANREIAYLFGIKKPFALAEIDFEALAEASGTNPEYRPLAKFPAVELDLSMELDQSAPYAEVVATAKKASQLIDSVSFLSEYRGDKVEAGKKALAIRLAYRDPEKTLTTEQAQAEHQKIVEVLKKEYNIKVR